MTHVIPNHRAIYTGSFDPITFGHLDVIERGRVIFDDLIVAIGRNIGKREVFSLDRRREMVTGLVREILDRNPSGGDVRVETYDGLTVEYARQVDAQIILRGIRNITDLAYECQLAMTNRQVANLETVFVMTSQEYAYTSSNLIKQIAALGGSLDQLVTIVPPVVVTALSELQAKQGLEHLIEDHVD